MIYIEQSQTEEETFFNYDTNNELSLPDWKFKLWVFVIIILIITFWLSLVGIYFESSLELAVAEGISSLNNIEPVSWVAFVVFILTIIFIYHIELKRSILGMFSVFKWCFCGCNIPNNIETKLQTPQWNINKSI